jgi:hypothetical protein
MDSMNIMRLAREMGFHTSEKPDEKDGALSTQSLSFKCMIQLT